MVDPDTDAVSVSQSLAKWERRLVECGVPSPASDARTLTAHVLGLSLGELVLRSDLTMAQTDEIQVLVERRCQREPLQHITGIVGFLGLDLAVGPGVFVPRPETELLADSVVRGLRRVPNLGLRDEDARPSPGDASTAPRVVVDLCAGSGALGLAIAANVDQVQCHAVELSSQAVRYAERNATENAAAIASRGSTYQLHEADAAVCDRAVLEPLLGRVDVVVCNPPYVPDSAIPREPEAREHDPKMALYGGSDGFDLVRKLLPVVASLLRAGGSVFIEHADTQGEAAGEAGLPSLLREYRDESTTSTIANPVVFESVEDHLDLNQRPRFTSARRSKV